jgi:hypothetical protein
MRGDRLDRTTKRLVTAPACREAVHVDEYIADGLHIGCLMLRCTLGVRARLYLCTQAARWNW